MKTGKLTKIIESQKVKDEERRTYIGASSIGSECLRQIWYDFTGAPASPIPLKLKRTFEIGKRLEGMVIDLMNDAGVGTVDSPPFADAMFPYFQGNVDALLFELNAILEIKTAKNASYNLFVKSGLRKWNPKYFAQIQSYMGMSGIPLAYILVINKDNSDLWDEEVNFDPDFYESLRQKAKLIFEAKTPPPRISSTPIWHQCRICKFKDICHN